MDKLKTSEVGGFPLLLNDLRQFFGRLASPSHGIYQAFNNLFRGFGDNFIIQGCIPSGLTPNISMTEGWIILDGELIKFDAQTNINTSTDDKFKKVTTFDSRGTKTFQNSTINETYEKNRAPIQGLVGNLSFNGDRLHYNLRGVNTDPQDFGTITVPLSGSDTFSVVDTSGKDDDISFMTARRSGSILKLLIDGGTPRVLIDQSGATPPADANGNPTNPLFLGVSTYTTTPLEELTFIRAPLGAFLGWILIGTNRIGAIAQGIIPAGINTDNVLLRTRKIEIGAWNMDADLASSAIAHGITDLLDKSPIVNVSIFNDTSNKSVPLFGQFTVLGVDRFGGSYELNNTTITLSRITDGLFDDTLYDSTTDPANRGFILITYEV